MQIDNTKKIPSEDDSVSESIRDITVGLIDGLTVPISVASGLYASGQVRETIILAIIAEAAAGSISMGLSDYLSVENTKIRKDVAFNSGIRVFLSYILGACVPLFSYLVTRDTKLGFYLSIILDILILIFFGYFRSIALEIDYINSITKVLSVGITAIFLTYIVSSGIVNSIF